MVSTPISMLDPNPRITDLLRAVTVVEVLVLAVAGPGLLMDVRAVVDIWPWALKPFNQRFLGAIYTAALLGALWQTGVGRWSPARLITLDIFVFTSVVSALSVLYQGMFDVEGRAVSVWIWFILYLGVCANSGAHLIWPRRLRPVGPRPPAVWRRALWALALMMGGLGLAHLVAPGWLGARWPWPIDTFHARLYSVTFLTPAASALGMLRATAPADWRAQGSMLLAWGLLPILGLWLADAHMRRVDWAGPTTWLWIAVFAAIAAFGLAAWREGGHR